MTLVVTPEQQREQAELVRDTQMERISLAQALARQLATAVPRENASHGIAYPDPELERVRQVLLFWANRLHAIYPQYKNHWDTWQLCRARRKLSSKAGHFAEKGDILLIDPKCEINSGLTCGPRVCVTVWGLREQWNHGTMLNDVEIL